MSQIEVTKKFHSDAGHGWLAVKRDELDQLGITKEISTCSYINGYTVYLEEDCDAGVYMNAQSANGVKVNFIELDSQDVSPIRSYARFVG